MNLRYETDRLVLRVLRVEDAPMVLQFYQDNKDVFEPFEPEHNENYYTLDYQKSVLRYEYNMTIKLSAVRFYVFLKEQPEQIIGTICFRNIVHSVYQSCELGYRFDENFWHNGYAFESLAMGLGVMFEDLKLHRIFADTMPSNLASIRLLVSLGFEQEGLLKKSILIRDKWEDHLRYALIRPEA